jgi:hypothetical protein
MKIVIASRQSRRGNPDFLPQANKDWVASLWS